MKTRRFPWFNNPTEIERRNFNVKHIPEQNIYVVTPSAKKFSWEYDYDSPYSDTSELNWRSSILDENGYEISGGLPKFMNYGEDVNSPVDKIIAKSVFDKKSVITKKEDGSLIIRSVVNNHVIFRTRGTHKLPSKEEASGIDFENLVLEVIKNKYPILMDETFLPHTELYFEFISPHNRVVVPYEEADLIFIHAKERISHRMLSWKELEEIASNGNLTIVQTINELNEAETPEEIKEIINKMEQNGEWPSEGIVIRDPSTGYMVKIKGDEYLKHHRLKASLNYKRLVELCEVENLTSVEELKKHLQEVIGLDWEIISVVEELFDIYIQRKIQFISLYQELSNFVASWQNECKSKDKKAAKKDFYFSVKDKPDAEKHTLLKIYDYGSDNPKSKDVLFNHLVLASVE